MGSEDRKDTMKNMDWKTLAGDSATNGAKPKSRVTASRFRQIPEYYFLPRRSWPYCIATYGSLMAAGVGAGMLLEVWINKKIQEDGGVVWEFDKK